MDKIRFMVVSGFLGAGKTTTMIALAQYMDEHCGKTAIIANDLGANLVDTKLTQSTGLTYRHVLDFFTAGLCHFYAAFLLLHQFFNATTIAGGYRRLVGMKSGLNPDIHTGFFLNFLWIFSE